MKDFSWVYSFLSFRPNISMIIPDYSVENEDRRFYKFYKIKPKCSVLELIDLIIKPRTYNGVGRDMDECEIHIDGDFLFMAFGALGAGLAFLTYQAITTKGKRRRKREAETIPNNSFLSSFLSADFADLIVLGIYYSLLNWNNHKSSFLSLQRSQNFHLCMICMAKK